MAHYKSRCGLQQGRWVRSDDLLLPSDLPAAWLAQALALIHRADCFDARLGSRVIPLIKSIGASMPFLASVPGSEERVRRMMRDRTTAPGSALFELAVAGRYCREGCRVEFIQEGSQRSPDFRVVSGSAEIHVECKRLQSSLYEAREACNAETLFEAFERFTLERRVNLFVEVRFTQELDSVPVDYLAQKAEQAITSPLVLPDGYPWADEYGSGVVRWGNLSAIRQDTSSEGPILVGPKFIRLLTRQALDPGKCLLSVRAQSAHSEDSRFIDDVELASVVYWECLAPESVRARARHVTSKLAEINQQAAGSSVAIAHIGMDAERDPVAADLRRSKNKKAILQFMPTSRLAEIEVHYFMPREFEHVSWAIDEMVDTFMARGMSPFLEDARLFPGVDFGDAAPWSVDPITGR